MRIDRRLATALAIGMLPLAIGAFMIAQDMGTIDRAKVEADGVDYAGLVLPELTSLARDKALPATPNPALAAAASANDGRLGTAAISEAYADLKADVANGAFPAAARQAAATLGIDFTCDSEVAGGGDRVDGHDRRDRFNEAWFGRGLRLGCGMPRSGGTHRADSHCNAPP